MCVQTQLHDHSARITALEAQHYSLEDLAAINAELDKISAFLFGAQRDKSNVVKT